jgi:fumarate reductase subunit D
MPRRQIEPFLWLLFSGGGVVAAMLAPIHLFLFGIAIPLGWLEPPAHDHLLALLRAPWTRVYLFVFCSLSLIHAAHRIRYTLYDGLQIKHLNEIVNPLCYGCALLGATVAGYLLLRVP